MGEPSSKPLQKPSPKPLPSTSRETVLEAVRILCENGQVATRHSVADLSGLALVRVDDCLKRLHDDCEIQRIGRGRYAPAPPPQSVRSMRWGCTSDGVWFIEAGGGRIDLDTTSPLALMRHERGRTVAYTLGDQSIELTAAEEGRAHMLRLAVGGGDWRDAVESQASRAGRVAEAVSLAR